MAFPNPDNIISLQSDGVVAIGAYLAVVKNAAGAVGLPQLPAGAAEDIVGVTQQGVANNDVTTNIAVAVGGVTLATAGGIIAAAATPQPLMVDATGRFVTLVAGAGNAHTANLLPESSFATTAAGDRIKIQILHNPLLT